MREEMVVGCREGEWGEWLRSRYSTIGSLRSSPRGQGEGQGELMAKEIMIGTWTLDCIVSLTLHSAPQLLWRFPAVWALQPLLYSHTHTHTIYMRGSRTDRVTSLIIITRTPGSGEISGSGQAGSGLLVVDERSGNWKWGHYLYSLTAQSWRRLKINLASS